MHHTGRFYPVRWPEYSTKDGLAFRTWKPYGDAINAKLSEDDKLFFFILPKVFMTGGLSLHSERHLG